MKEKISKAFILVDMVNGFVNEGAMSDKFIAHIIPRQHEYMKEIQKDENSINIIIKDMHKENCREFTHYPVHCVENTSESEVVDELKEFELGNEEFVFPKNSTSAIFAPRFIETIEALKDIEEIVIGGCCTDICVLNLAIPLQNYFDQMDRNVKITIYKDMVETYDSPTHNREEYNEMAFKLMSQAGINII